MRCFDLLLQTYQGEQNAPLVFSMEQTVHSFCFFQADTFCVIDCF